MTDNGYAGPSVANGKLYIIDHLANQDIVRAMDVNTGIEAWRYSFVDASNDNYGYCRSTPTVDEGKVFTLSRKGNVNCLDAATGAVIWTKNIVKDFQGRIPGWELAMSPLIDGDKVILIPGGDQSAVVALNKKTGEVIWKGTSKGTPGYATPVLATIRGVKQYIVLLERVVAGIDAATGNELWSFPWQSANGVSATTPRVINDTVLLGTGYGDGRTKLIEITEAGPVERWLNNDIKPKFTTQVILNGYGYSTGDANKTLLTCFDVKTGAIKWAQPGFGLGGMVAVDGTLIVMDGSNGAAVMINPTPDDYQELGRFTPLGGETWTAPIIADGKLIVRNKKTLGCFKLK